MSLSTTESEYLAAAGSLRSILWLKHLLQELGYIDELTVKVDNTSALQLLKNPQFYRRTKHIEVKYFAIRERVENGDQKVVFTRSCLNIANILTKPIGRVNYEKLIDLSGLVELKHDN